MNKIAFKISRRYFVLFLLCVFIIIISINNNYGFIDRFFECLFYFDEQVEFLYNYGKIPSISDNYSFFEIYQKYNEVFYYGYESMIIWSTQLFQILLPIIAAISSFWIFKERTTIDNYILIRENSYKHHILRKIIFNSVKVALSFFIAYIILLIFVELIGANKDGMESARYILTDIFTENLYFNHMLLYFLLEGFIRFFIMPFVYSFFASSLVFVVDRPWMAFLIPNLYYFGLTTLGFLLLSTKSFLSRVALYISPSVLMASGDYAGFSTILLILVNCIPIVFGVSIIMYKIKSYERL